MAGCSPLYFKVEWDKIPVQHILKNMTSMTSTLNGAFGQYAKLYESHGAETTEQNEKTYKESIAFDNIHGRVCRCAATVCFP